jgi:hypothetical protein
MIDQGGGLMVKRCIYVLCLGSVLVLQDVTKCDCILWKYHQCFKQDEDGYRSRRVWRENLRWQVRVMEIRVRKGRETWVGINLTLHI